MLPGFKFQKCQPSLSYPSWNQTITGQTFNLGYNCQPGLIRKPWVELTSLRIQNLFISLIPLGGGTRYGISDINRFCIRRLLCWTCPGSRGSCAAPGRVGWTQPWTETFAIYKSRVRFKEGFIKRRAAERGANCPGPQAMGAPRNFCRAPVIFLEEIFSRKGQDIWVFWAK